MLYCTQIYNTCTYHYIIRITVLANYQSENSKNNFKITIWKQFVSLGFNYIYFVFVFPFLYYTGTKSPKKITETQLISSITNGVCKSVTSFPSYVGMTRNITGSIRCSCISNSSTLDCTYISSSVVGRETVNNDGNPY